MLTLFLRSSRHAAFQSFLRATLLAPLALTLACGSNSGETPDAGPAPIVTPPNGSAPDASQPSPPTSVTPVTTTGACPAPTGAGTTHKADITADETWTAADSPHRLAFHTRVLATVTIEACATVLVGDGYSINVGSSDRPGKLVARGQRGSDALGKPTLRPVRIAAADVQKPWGSISVAARGDLDLEATVLTDAASPSSDQNGGGAILVYGTSQDATPAPSLKTIRLVDVEVAKSRGYGINLWGFSGFSSDSKNILIREGGRMTAPYPLRLEFGSARTIPTGFKAEKNARDEIELIPRLVAMPSDTIVARGLPYHVSGRVRVAPIADGAPVTLTIEPGATLRFDNDRGDSGLQLGTSDKRQGLLVAEGTAAAPITFTSGKTTPVAGDWKNIYFSHSPNTGNRLNYAVVEYAGAPSGAQGFGCGPIENDASVLILSARPTAAFIQNSIIRNAAGDTGILLGWVSDESGPDFVTSNMFVNAPACRVSRWRNAMGIACPGSMNGSPLCL